MSLPSHVHEANSIGSTGPARNPGARPILASAMIQHTHCWSLESKADL